MSLFSTTKSLTDAATSKAIEHEVKLGRWHVGAVFFALGFIFASWAVNVPAIRDTFALKPIELTLLLWMHAGGAIIATLLLGRWLARLPTKTLYCGAGIMISLSAMLIFTIPVYWGVLIAQVVFGMATATIDVAMNAQASVLERNAQKPLMSMLHGMWSVGGIVGGALGGLFFEIGMAAWMRIGVAAAITLAILLFARTISLWAEPPAQATTATATSSPANLAWLLGSIAIVGLIGEGAMYNWSSIYVRDAVHGSAAFASHCYATFAGGMALARFAGDRLRNRFGAARLIRFGTLSACLSTMLVIALPYPIVVLGGFFVTGVGISNSMPLLFSAAANIDPRNPAQNLARMAGLGYTGVFMGPVLIGAIIEWKGLSAGMSMVAFSCAFVALLAPALLGKLLPKRAVNLPVGAEFTNGAN